MRPICIKCQRFFRCKKNDFFFIEAMPVNGEAEPGNVEPEKWKPYKVWAADRYECEGCGTSILSGFGRSPLAEHYQPNFAKAISIFGADQFQVNDCS